jgi:chromosome partitioning protein
MRVISFMNQKGGVGKTTTCANLAAALAEMGARVCLLDIDPQAHLTINFGVDVNEKEQPRVNLYDVLVGDVGFLDAVLSLDSNLSIVPGSIDLAAAEIELVNTPGRETILRRKLEQAVHDFDYVLMDCPPSLGLLTINALACSGEVFIPMQPHFLAMQGFAKLIETVKLVGKQINPRLRVTGVVLTMFDSQVKLSHEIVSELENFTEQSRGKNVPWNDCKVFRTKIRRNIKLAECPGYGQTVLQYDSSSNGAQDYRQLAREVATMRTVAPPIGRGMIAELAADSVQESPARLPTQTPSQIAAHEPSIASVGPIVQKALNETKLNEPKLNETQPKVAVTIAPGLASIVPSLAKKAAATPEVAH